MTSWLVSVYFTSLFFCSQSAQKDIHFGPVTANFFHLTYITEWKKAFDNEGDNPFTEQNYPMLKRSVLNKFSLTTCQQNALNFHKFGETAGKSCVESLGFRLFDGKIAVEIVMKKYVIFF